MTSSDEGITRVSEMGRSQENNWTQQNCEGQGFTCERGVVMSTKTTERGSPGEEASLRGRVIILVLVMLSLKCSWNTQKERTVRKYICRNRARVEDPSLRSLGDSYIAPELNTLASLLSQLSVDFQNKTAVWKEMLTCWMQETKEKNWKTDSSSRLPSSWCCRPSGDVQVMTGMLYLRRQGHAS